MDKKQLLGQNLGSGEEKLLFIHLCITGHDVGPYKENIVFKCSHIFTKRAAKEHIFFVCLDFLTLKLVESLTE